MLKTGSITYLGNRQFEWHFSTESGGGGVLSDTTFYLSDYPEGERFGYWTAVTPTSLTQETNDVVLTATVPTLGSWFVRLTGRVQGEDFEVFCWFWTEDEDTNKPLPDRIRAWIARYLEVQRPLIEESLRKVQPDFTFKTYGQVPLGDAPCLLVDEPEISAGGWIYMPGGREWWIGVPIFFLFTHQGTNKDITLMARAQNTLRITFDRFLSQNVNLSEFPIDMAIMGNTVTDESDLDDNTISTIIGFQVNFLTHLSTLHWLAG